MKSQRKVRCIKGDKGAKECVESTQNQQQGVSKITSQIRGASSHCLMNGWMNEANVL